MSNPDLQKIYSNISNSHCAFNAVRLAVVGLRCGDSELSRAELEGAYYSLEKALSLALDDLQNSLDPLWLYEPDKPPELPT